MASLVFFEAKGEKRRRQWGRTRMRSERIEKNHKDTFF